jgi:chromosome segregation ATPase
MNKDIRLTGMIDNLNKKIKELYKYKNFVELNRNSKKLYDRFTKMQMDNLILVKHVKNEKNNFQLLQRENIELKKVLNKLKNDGLSYENKKKFYEINLKNNEINEKNDELKNIIKNKENRIIEINNEMIIFKEENENIKIILNHFSSNIANFINQQVEQKETLEVLEEKELIKEIEIKDIEETDEDLVSKTEERGSYRKEAELGELEEAVAELDELNVNFLN